MEIQPASLAQVLQGRGGRQIEIDDDVLGVAEQLRKHDPQLRLRFSEAGGYFVVYQQFEDGRQKVVTTAQELDGRIIQRILKISSGSYNYAEELDRLDREADKRGEHEASEQLGEIGERLQHAIRKDLSTQNRIYVPGEK